MTPEKDYSLPLMGRSRRSFLIATAALGLTSLLGIKAKGLPETFFPIADLDQLLGFRVLPPEHPVDANLTGILPNHPLLWMHANSKEKIDHELEKLRKIPTRLIRTFLDDRVEPALGKYRFDYLDLVAKLGEEVSLEVDLHDAFNILHSEKLNNSYASHESTSPYLGKRDGRGLEERRIAFFQDPSIIEATQNRFYTIVSYLKGVRGIKAWCVGNEFEAAGDVLNNWYAQMLPVIQEADSTRPILSGVADPNSIDEERLKPLGLSANTIHIFPEPQILIGGNLSNILGSNLERKMKSYLSDHRRVLPLVCQEIGFPRLPGDFAYDFLFSRFLNAALLCFIEVNQKDGWIRPLATGLGPWKFAAEEKESDGHEIVPDEIPETLSTFWSWNEIMEKANSPSSNAA